MINRSPTIIIGIDRVWPIVTPNSPKAIGKSERIVGGEELRVRDTEKFHEVARRAVPGHEHSGKQSRPAQAAEGGNRDQYHKQDQPLEARLVELGRVARAGPDNSGAILGARAREYDAPTHIRGPPPEFGIYEICDAAEKEARRRGQREEVRHWHELDAISRAEVNECKDDAQEPPVEGHPAIPDAQDVKWVRQVKFQIVEEHVADPPPKITPRMR